MLHATRGKPITIEGSPIQILCDHQGILFQPFVLRNIDPTQVLPTVLKPTALNWVYVFSFNTLTDRACLLFFPGRPHVGIESDPNALSYYEGFFLTVFYIVKILLSVQTIQLCPHNSETRPGSYNTLKVLQ